MHIVRMALKRLDLIALNDILKFSLKILNFIISLRFKWYHELPIDN